MQMFSNIGRYFYKLYVSQLEEYYRCWYDLKQYNRAERAFARAENMRLAALSLGYSSYDDQLESWEEDGCL